MKDFEEFKKCLNQDIIDTWCEEAHNHVMEKVGEPGEDSGLDWSLIYHRSFNFAITMKLLEHYHKWLSE